MGGPVNAAVSKLIKIGELSALVKNITERCMSMKRTMYLVMAMALVISFAGCTSKSTKIQDKEKGATSDARITLTKKYTDCVSKAAGDKAAIEVCDAILKSIKKLD